MDALSNGIWNYSVNSDHQCPIIAIFIPHKKKWFIGSICLPIEWGFYVPSKLSNIMAMPWTKFWDVHANAIIYSLLKEA